MMANVRKRGKAYGQKKHRQRFFRLNNRCKEKSRKTVFSPNFTLIPTISKVLDSTDMIPPPKGYLDQKNQSFQNKSK